jgi:hypothetical protein
MSWAGFGICKISVIRLGRPDSTFYGQFNDRRLPD